MENQNKKKMIAIGAVLAGIALMELTPVEVLSPEEQAAGVMSYKSIGAVLLIAGGSYLFVNMVKSKI
jgi:predicted aconitase with swiveling domain